MFDKLRALLGSGKEETDTNKPARQHHLAVTALLLEAASLDGDIGEREKATIARLISQKFDFDAEATAALMREATAEQATAVEIYNFTRQIKDTFDADERVEMIEMLWEVVYADEELHDYEASLLRRVSGLLHVPDRIAGDAKKRVRDRLGIDAG